MLTLKTIHKTFEAGTINENHVLRGLDLQVAEGDFISIIGGNGAGKSTLMNCLAGTLMVDEGEIVLDGQTITNLPAAKRAKLISRVFQDPKQGTASRLTIEENLAVAYKRGQSRGLAWGVRDHQRQLFQEELKVLGLGLENRLKVATEFLSGGQRQALTLVMAALVKPKLLLLDEHTAALDPKTSQALMGLTESFVTEDRLTALMITHQMADAFTYGNRLLVMKDGQIIQDLGAADKAKLTQADYYRLFD